MTTFATRTIREIALYSPASTRVLNEFNINYICDGGISLNDACEIGGIPMAAVVERLDEVVKEIEKDGPTLVWPTATELVDHLETEHHELAWRAIAAISDRFDSLPKERYSEFERLAELRQACDTLFTELRSHMRKEEDELFPFIRNLEMAVLYAISLSPVSFVTVASPIRTSKREHAREMDLIQEIRRLSSNFAMIDDLPEDIVELLSDLNELEQDLLRHMHLENNVLFPLVMTLESRLYF
jgi:regulator of cell morphogenesis and NO signaling